MADYTQKLKKFEIKNQQDLQLRLQLTKTTQECLQGLSSGRRKLQKQQQTLKSAQGHRESVQLVPMHLVHTNHTQQYFYTHRALNTQQASSGIGAVTEISASRQKSKAEQLDNTYESLQGEYFLQQGTQQHCDNVHQRSVSQAAQRVSTTCAQQVPEGASSAARESIPPASQKKIEESIQKQKLKNRLIIMSLKKYEQSGDSQQLGAAALQKSQPHKKEVQSVMLSARKLSETVDINNSKARLLSDTVEESVSYRGEQPAAGTQQICAQNNNFITLNAQKPVHLDDSFNEKNLNYSPTRKHQNKKKRVHFLKDVKVFTEAEAIIKQEVREQGRRLIENKLEKTLKMIDFGPRATQKPAFEVYVGTEEVGLPRTFETLLPDSETLQSTATPRIKRESGRIGEEQLIRNEGAMATALASLEKCLAATSTVQSCLIMKKIIVDNLRMCQGEDFAQLVLKYTQI